MIPKFIKIAVVIVILLLILPISPLQFINGGFGGGGNPTTPTVSIRGIIGGQLHLAVVYLYHDVSYDYRILNGLKQVIEVASSTDYSVKSFYAKYGINIVPSYYSSPVGKIPDQPNYVNFDFEMISWWMQVNPAKAKSIYNGNEVICFVLDANVPTHRDAGWLITGGQAYGFALTGFFIIGLSGPNVGYGFDSYKCLSSMKSNGAYTIAHEIGHEFGGCDHYSGATGELKYEVNGKANPIADDRCLMNVGGNNCGNSLDPNGGYPRLSKGMETGWWSTYSVDTIFGSEDLKYLHFSYVWKDSYASLDRVHVTVGG